MPFDPRETLELNVRGVVERVLRRNLSTLPSDGEIERLARNVAAHQALFAELGALPLHDEDAATPPQGEPRL